MLTPCLESFADGLRPVHLLSIADCAERYRRLAPEDSAEPGPYSVDRTPYAREVMAALDDPRYSLVVAMWASQLGKTSILLNWVVETIVQTPCPMMIVQPTVETAERFSKQRVAPMISASPELARRVASEKSRQTGNTLNMKKFDGGVLLMVGANAPSGLASTPIRRLAVDEIDRMGASAGDEGNPHEIARARMTSFGDAAKEFVCSSPTIKGASRIDTLYAASDQRIYLVPCPHCGAEQELQWEHMRWEPGDPRSAVYVCEANGCIIEEHAKDSMLPAGRWEAQGVSEVPGFRLSTLYAPLGWFSWAKLVTQYEAALASGDPEDMKVFVNTRLGRVFDEELDYSPPDGWQERAEKWPNGIPRGGTILTAGVDIQDDRAEVEVVAWGPGEESWSVAYHVIPGDPTGPALWNDLDVKLRQTFRSESGAQLGISVVCVDTGYQTHAVHAFCAPRLGRRIYPIKGVSGPEPIWPRRPRKAGGGKWKYFPVGVDKIKERVLHRLSAPPLPDGTFPAGYCHVPEGRGAQWFAQMRAEKKQVSIVNGRTVVRWVQTARRNEALDCRVYAYAALHALLAALGWKDVPPPAPASAPAAPSPARPAPPPPRESYAARFRNGGRD